MTFLSALHGAAATLLLCGLLFAEEAGVPIPFAPGEVTLMAAGLLISTGGLNPFVFIPLAWVACGAGSLAGYLWAARVGARGLETVASKVGGAKALDRVSERLKRAGPGGIALSRLIPGLRIYTTLVAGALRLSLRDFLVGALPAMAAWVIGFTVLGALVGLPAMHFFNRFERLAARGAILVLLGIGGWLAVRRIPPAQMEEGPFAVAPDAWRRVLGAAIDLGIVASAVAGVGAVIRVGFDASSADSWVEVAVIASVIGLIYVLVTRRGTGATAGEALFRTTYRRLPRPHRHRTHPG